MSKGYMYILECSDGSYYTGSTKYLETRLAQHQAGKGANHTKKRLPVKLVYFEEFSIIDDAFYREKQVQGWSRKKKEALIDGIPEKLHDLAKCMNETAHVGFDSAQPTGSAQPTDSAPLTKSERSLSEVETKENETSDLLIDDAFYREKQVQGWSRKKKKALIDGIPEKLHIGFDSAQPTDSDQLNNPMEIKTKGDALSLSKGDALSLSKGDALSLSKGGSDE